MAKQKKVVTIIELYSSVSRGQVARRREVDGKEEQQLTDASGSPPPCASQPVTPVTLARLDTRSRVIQLRGQDRYNPMSSPAEVSQKEVLMKILCDLVSMYTNLRPALTERHSSRLLKMAHIELPLCCHKAQKKPLCSLLQSLDQRYTSGRECSCVIMASR